MDGNLIGKNQYIYKYFIIISYNNIEISNNWIDNAGAIYFKTRELAQRAIEILGEETIKLALSTDW